MSHVPVLLAEVMAALALAPGELGVDGTYGGGGYTRAMLDAGATVVAFDRDPSAAAAADTHPRLTLHTRVFGELADVLPPASADAVTFDVGVSSMQLDRPERGFSFQHDGPLDMRMGNDGPTAADLVNTLEEGALADILYRYGDEPASRRIARALVAARPVTTTAELAGVVRRVLGHHPGMPRDPATRTFQALRIAVNDELGELGRGLTAAETVLKPGGRLAVVSFHSLEDRMVKTYLRARGGQAPAGSRHLPATQSRPPSFTAVAKPVTPGPAELAANPRARSARLRVATRTAAPAWGDAA